MPGPDRERPGQRAGTDPGRIHDRAAHCINPAGPDPFAFTNGTFTKTNASGDQLQGTYAGRIIPTATSNADGEYLLDGALLFTGGTGKFAGASGGAAISGLFNVQTGAAGVVTDGEIFLVGGAHRVH